MVEFQRPDGKNLNIEVIQYQSDNFVRQKREEIHRHNFHSIFYIQNGYSVQEIDFEHYEINAHQIVIIPKGATHWEQEAKNIKGYAILFTDDFFSIVQKELLNGFLQYAIALRKLILPVPNEQVKNIEYYFELLNEEQQFENNQNQTFILQNLMLALLNKLEGLMPNTAQMNDFISKRRPFQKFIALVEDYHLQQKHLDFYTAQLQLTQRQLNKILKETIGQTASQFLIDRIITSAKRELCFGDKTIKEIAYDLGYDNQYYFSRIFKKRTNLSPEQFRNQFAE
jgi:AraC-like DNA-binding protein